MCSILMDGDTVGEKNLVQQHVGKKLSAKSSKKMCANLILLTENKAVSSLLATKCLKL